MISSRDVNSKFLKQLLSLENNGIYLLSLLIKIYTTHLYKNTGCPKKIIKLRGNLTYRPLNINFDIKKK